MLYKIEILSRRREFLKARNKYISKYTKKVLENLENNFILKK
jgi:hypothetical protein